MRKRVTIFGLAFIMLFSLLMFTGCSEYSGREIEVDGWTLFRFRQSGQVNIISANCESLVADGVLYIPSRIGRYNIHGFGRHEPIFWYGSRDHHFRIDEKLEVERVVLAAALHINHFIGNIGFATYVELLCNTFERIVNLPWQEERLFIIPDGSSQTFYDRFKTMHYSGEFYFMRFYFIEKTDWLTS